VEFQGTYWLIFYAPTAALIFLVSNIAEIGRAPFDLIEAESELVAGFMIEYSAMAFAMFYLAEFLHAFLVSVLFTVLFLGGWQGPWAAELPILGLGYLAIKSLLVYFIMMWARMTLPRFRIDHLMAFNWKFLVPLSLVNLVVLGFVWKFFPTPDLDGEFYEEWINGFPRMAGMLIASLVVGLGGLALLRNYAHRQREAITESLALERREYPLAVAPDTSPKSNVIVVSGGD
jgi:NADH-quinone oxidoreductase subunit H